MTIPAMPHAARTERRAFQVESLRIEKRAGDTPPTITGHAAVFNRNSEEMWGFVERVAPGAFSESIGQDDIRALWNHDPNYVLGRNRSKTLQLSEDATGLAIVVGPPDTQWARDLLVSIERGDVSQMSFGFITITDDWHTEEGLTVRTLKKVQLFDVSPVTFPAYPDTDVGVRSLEMIAAEGRTVLAARATPIVTGVPASILRRQLDTLDL